MSQILHILVAHEHVGRIANVLWKIELIFPKHLLNGLGIEIPRIIINMERSERYLANNMRHFES